jgi:hypothetical protein
LVRRAREQGLSLQEALPDLPVVRTLNQTVRSGYEAAGNSQRGIAREMDIDRRKVKGMVDRIA